MTLIEMMVVLVIMSLIAAAVSIPIVRSLETSRERAALTWARTIQQAVMQYLFDHPSDCPTTDALLKAELLEATTSPNDPWGHAYLIECEGSTIHVHSGGKDGSFGTQDDIGF